MEREVVKMIHYGEMEWSSGVVEWCSGGSGVGLEGKLSGLVV